MNATDYPYLRALHLAYLEGDDLALPAYLDYLRDRGFAPDEIWAAQLPWARQRLAEKTPDARERYLTHLRECVEIGYEQWCQVRGIDPGNGPHPD